MCIQGREGVAGTQKTFNALLKIIRFTRFPIGQRKMERLLLETKLRLDVKRRFDNVHVPKLAETYLMKTG